MKVKIEELSLIYLIQVTLDNLKINGRKECGCITYPSDGIFLLKDIVFNENVSEEALLISIENAFNLNLLINKFLIDISIEESILTDNYIFKTKCFGSKRYWETDSLIKSCLFAVLGWFVTEKYIEVHDGFANHDSDDGCEIYIESLNLPILLVLKLKNKNFKTLADLKSIEDQTLLNELRSHGVQI